MHETHISRPSNEPVLQFRPESDERRLLMGALDAALSRNEVIMPVVNGREVPTGDTGFIRPPHDHHAVLAKYHKTTPELAKDAIESAMGAKRDWESIPWEERASIAMKAAELVSRKYRFDLIAATMLGQGKGAYQAEIDAACETVDFLRFNAHFMKRIYAEQLESSSGILNRMDYRPLEGFVLAVTPFNFTAIAANLPTAPAFMGNVVVWKPSSASLLSNSLLMRIFAEAGFPKGVLNFLPGSGEVIGRVALNDRRLAGIHFTGSTPVFNKLWETVGGNLKTYQTYPKLVGETGGKGFIFVHPSAEVASVATAMIRGAFEYQGQKCSAASRAYVPRSLWEHLRKTLLEKLAGIRMGDVRDFGCFMNAVIDKSSFDAINGYIEMARNSKDASIISGGGSDGSVGYYIEPTVIETKNPYFVTMEEEVFGPVLTVFVYEDADCVKVLDICDKTSPYALTGAVFASERRAISIATETLRNAAGNFYINDKPTGAVVGQQPFGGARRSGTNDKTGSHMNLLCWVSPRTIKENLLPPTDFTYPFMGTEER